MAPVSSCLDYHKVSVKEFADRNEKRAYDAAVDRAADQMDSPFFNDRER
jgi:hypothetical protein